MYVYDLNYYYDIERTISVLLDGEKKPKCRSLHKFPPLKVGDIIELYHEKYPECKFIVVYIGDYLYYNYGIYKDLNRNNYNFKEVILYRLKDLNYDMCSIYKEAERSIYRPLNYYDSATIIPFLDESSLLYKIDFLKSVNYSLLCSTYANSFQKIFDQIKYNLLTLLFKELSKEELDDVFLSFKQIEDNFSICKKRLMFFDERYENEIEYLKLEVPEYIKSQIADKNKLLEILNDIYKKEHGMEHEDFWSDRFKFTFEKPVDSEIIKNRRRLIEKSKRVQKENTENLSVLKRKKLKKNTVVRHKTETVNIDELMYYPSIYRENKNVIRTADTGDIKCCILQDCILDHIDLNPIFDQYDNQPDSTLLLIDNKDWVIEFIDNYRKFSRSIVKYIYALKSVKDVDYIFNEIKNRYKYRFTWNHNNIKE